MRIYWLVDRLPLFIETIIVAIPNIYVDPALIKALLV